MALILVMRAFLQDIRMLLSTILADELGMGQTFQKSFVSRIEQSPNNGDTLLQVISDFFLSNDAHLKEMNRTDISTYVLIGGWLEGMYLGSNMATKEERSNGIDQIVVGQKGSISNLNKLLMEVEQPTEVIEQLKTAFSRARTSIH